MPAVWTMELADLGNHGLRIWAKEGGIGPTRRATSAELTCPATDVIGALEADLKAEGALT